ncbi:hypothetical protein MMPV_007797 [Pyropia vietnamensis]
MAAPFLAEAAVCRWLFLKDLGAADAEVLRCPAALAAAHVHTIRRVADCCNSGESPRVDWSSVAGGGGGGGGSGSFAGGSCAGGKPPGFATPTSVVGGPVVADLRLVSRHVNGFLVGIAVNAVVPPGEGGRDGDEAANDGPSLMSPPQTLSRRWAAHCPAEGKVVLIEFGWMRHDNHAMVRLFTWTRSRGGSGANATAPVVSFQGTVLTHAGARPGKLPPADIVARVSFNERSCGPCLSLAEASSAAGTALNASGGCGGRCFGGCVHPSASHRGSVGTDVPSGNARKANVELSRCTDEVTESVLSHTRHTGVGAVGFGGDMTGSGIGSAIGSGVSSGARTLSSNCSHTLSTSTSSGVRAVGSSGPQTLTTRAFVDFLAAASVSCATITSTGVPPGSAAPSSSGSATSSRQTNWASQKRSLVVSHSAVDWRTPSLVSPALRALLSPLVEPAEVDRLLNEAASLFRTQLGRRSAGSDVPVAGSHDRPPRWEAPGAAAPPRLRYSPRAPTARSLDGGAVTDGAAASGVSREALLPPQGAPSRGAPPPAQQSSVPFPPYGLPRSSGPNSGTAPVQPLHGQGGVQVSERPVSLPPSTMQQASPYGPGSFGGVPVSPVVSGISPMSLAGMGAPPRGHTTSGSTVSPMSLSPMHPLIGGMPALHGGDHRSPLPSEGTPYDSVYGPALGVTAAVSDPRNLSTVQASMLPPSSKTGGFRMRPSVVPPSGTNALSPPAFVLPRVWPSAANSAAGLPGATSGVAQGASPSQGVVPMGLTVSHPEVGDNVGPPLSGGHTGVAGLAPPSVLGSGLPESTVPGHHGSAQVALDVHSGARPLQPDEAEGLYPVAKRARIGSPSTAAVPIPCDICGRNFATRGDRNRHQRTVHEKARRHPCTVPGCTAAFSESSHVRTHMRTVHERRRDFVCDICNAALSTRSVLAKHKRNVHDDYRPYPCTMCELRFSQRCDLVRHSRRAHSTSTPTEGRPAADAVGDTAGGADPNASALLPGAPRAGGVPSSAAPPRVY